MQVLEEQITITKSSHDPREQNRRDRRPLRESQPRSPGL